jgi:hypothetical protein
MFAGLLGGVMGLSRIRGTGATHKTGHHCTPSDNHDCETCLSLGSTCDPVAPACCQDTPTNCEVVENFDPDKVCGSSGESQCCRLDGGSCANHCDCCGTRFCCDNQCINDNCDGLD